MAQENDEPTLAEVRAEIAREVRMRHQVYPGLIARGKLTREAAARQIRVMEAALALLPTVPAPPDLFNLNPTEGTDE